MFFGKVLIICNLLLISWEDKCTHRISNKSLVYLLVTILLYALQEEPQKFTDKIIGILIVSMPMLVIAILWPGSFGGGDIKLMAICGLLLGKNDILHAAWIALLMASAFAGCLLLLEKRRKKEFALGPFICIGVLSVFLDIL